MVNKSGAFVSLAKRADFNLSVSHIQAVIEITDNLAPSKNAADMINEMIMEHTIKPEQVKAILSVLLTDKWQYKVVSKNITAVLEDTSAFVNEVRTWCGADIVLGYEHPDLGFIAVNPKNPQAAAVIQEFKKHELLLIFVGKQDKGAIDPVAADAVVSAILKLFEKLYGHFGFNGRNMLLPRLGQIHIHHCVHQQIF